MAPDDEARGAIRRIALLGNPNTGKTTLFNRLCGLRHKTSNFPGTTQDARIGSLRDSGPGVELVDLPGVYSLELDQSEAGVCREVLAGRASGGVGAPDAVCVVLDATNLARNLVLAGEALRRRLPTVLAVNMVDLARARGLHVDAAVLGARMGCDAVLVSARTGEGLDDLTRALRGARVPNLTPPGHREALERWAEEAWAECASAAAATGVTRGPRRFVPSHTRITDALDSVLMHPVLGVGAFALIMAALFWTIFSLATIPMDLIDAVFSGRPSWAAPWQPGWLRVLIGDGLRGLVRWALPPGLVQDLLADGVVSGIGATVVFIPQICLLFFLISLLEDSGYLARGAFVVDRLLRPFGLRGHSFVPLLSSHACALPGIMACRAIPDRRERLATILVAPFMTCSARLPVYVLVTSVLFAGRPALAAMAFVGCYALGIAAGAGSALIARRTILRGASRPMAMELPTYKAPSVRTALITSVDRGMAFLKTAGTNILLISIVLWWLGAFPRVAPPPEALALRAQAEAMLAGPASPGDATARDHAASELLDRAAHVEASHAKARSYIGRVGRLVQPAFEPLGYDWRLTVGVLTSFAAREVFASTLAVLVAGTEDAEDKGVLRAIAGATRDDGVTPVFTRATAWSVLVFFVLAMQCLPTLVVTARETGHAKWALLQFAWMSVLAYGAALVAYQVLA